MPLESLKLKLDGSNAGPLSRKGLKLSLTRNENKQRQMIWSILSETKSFVDFWIVWILNHSLRRKTENILNFFANTKTLMKIWSKKFANFVSYSWYSCADYIVNRLKFTIFFRGRLAKFLFFSYNHFEEFTPFSPRSYSKICYFFFLRSCSRIHFFPMNAL